MAMKVYQVGDTVEIIKDANPTIIIQQQFCAVRIVADDVTVYSFLDGTITESDTVANIQNVGGSPIGNLQDVVRYLSKFIFSGSTTSNPIPTSGGGGTGEANTGSNVGTGDGVFKQKTGVDLEFKTLIGGTNTTITNNANDLTIDVTGTGEVNTASNVGTGDGVFKQKTGFDLEMKTLIGGTSVTIVNNTNDLTIDVTGTGLNVLETATLDGNIITPAQLLADQDDYNPTGFSTCNMIRQDINGQRVITGFVAPAAGVNRIFAINNLSASSNIKFKNNDPGSAAANRLLLRDNSPDKSIKENETAIFWYDHISSRWRPYNRIG